MKTQRIPLPLLENRLAVHVRWLIRRDMPEVLDIEAASSPAPWAEEDFLRTLRQRNCIGTVAEHGEKVVGFMIYELHKTKLHLLKIAVSPDCRRRQVGTQMVEKLRSKLRAHERTCVTTEDAGRSLPAMKFFAALGFRGESSNDGIVFSWALPDAVVADEMDELLARLIDPNYVGEEPVAVEPAEPCSKCGQWHDHCNYALPLRCSAAEIDCWCGRPAVCRGCGKCPHHCNCAAAPDKAI